jgi:hypothetical protein
MSSSFYNADKSMHRKVILAALICCALFVAAALFARAQPENSSLVKKAERQAHAAAAPAAPLIN